jgi:hypothetical protein
MAHMASDVDAHVKLKRIEVLIEAISPFLAYEGADVQGAVLCRLVAMHLAGHVPRDREPLLQLHIDTVRKLIPDIEQQAFGAKGHPFAKGF